jgi:hypothetical protein
LKGNPIFVEAHFRRAREMYSFLSNSDIFEVVYLIFDMNYRDIHNQPSTHLSKLSPVPHDRGQVTLSGGNFCKNRAAESRGSRELG